MADPLSLYLNILESFLQAVLPDLLLHLGNLIVETRRARRQKPEKLVQLGQVGHGAAELVLQGLEAELLQLGNHMAAVMLGTEEGDEDQLGWEHLVMVLLVQVMETEEYIQALFIS